MPTDNRVSSITPRHILSDSGGFPNWRNADLPLKTYFQPGEQFSYSGEGFLYLQKAVEAITGEKIHALAERLVLQPFAMARSSFIWDWRFDLNRAYPHDAFGRPALGGKPGEGNAAWSLQTTAADFASFLLAILHGSRLQSETARLWLHPHIAIQHPGIQCLGASDGDAVTGVVWGLGWGLEPGKGALLQSLRRSAMDASSEGGGAVSDFKGRHFGGEIVLWAVRWYCRYGISYRDLEQMMAERGVSVDHSTIYRWVQRYAPEIEKRLRWHWRWPRSRSWRVDETYVKVCGKWSYLYRAVDKLGNTIDFYLSPTRNTMAAKRLLAKALRGLKDWEQPEVINTDKAPTYAAALAALKAEGKCPKDTQHRQVKYLNNIVEADHGKLKQLIRPVRGFKSMKTAYATIKGFEVMRALRKGQAAIFNLTRDILGEARLVERAFGLGACALTEAVQLVGERLEAA